MSKFKVGDRVRNVGYGDFGHMGDIGIVVEEDGSCVPYRVKFSDEKTIWFQPQQLVAGSGEKIIITQDGTTTLARLYEGKKVIKSAEAICSPIDTFDFATGANIAYDRLMRPEPATKPSPEPIKLYCVKDFNPDNLYQLTKDRTYEIINKRMIYDGGVRGNFDHESWESYKKQHDDFAACLVPLVNRPAKVGEWVYIVKNNGGAVVTGSVWEVTGSRTGGVLELTLGYYTSANNYLVLDGYHPESSKGESYAHN